MATAKPRAQMALAEKALENPQLEDVLERRQDSVAGHQEYSKRDKAAKAIIDELDLPIGLYRIGRFVINVTKPEGDKKVEFTRTASKSARIKLAKEPEDDSAE